MADWKQANKDDPTDSGLTDFQLDFLVKGQAITGNLRKAEDEYSVAATEARRLHVWAGNDSCTDQSSRFPSNDSVDEESLRLDEEHAREHTDRDGIMLWRKRIQDRGDPDVAGSGELTSGILAMKGVVVGETPWEFMDGRRRRHIEKWNDRRSKAWKSMTENWQECTYDQKHQADVTRPPDARPDSPPRSTEKAASESDCGVEVNGRSLTYSTKRQRRSR